MLTAARPSIKCMVEVRPTCRTMLEFILDMLNSSTDAIYLAKPRGIDGEGLETPMSRRMLGNFSDQVRESEFRALRRPLPGDPVKALSQVCHVVYVMQLLWDLQICPNSWILSVIFLITRKLL